jgi:hypothetical protein
VLEFQPVFAIGVVGFPRAVIRFICASRAWAYIDRRNQKERLGPDGGQSCLEPPGVSSILLRLLVRDPFCRWQTGANEAFKAPALQRFEIRAIDEQVEVLGAR